MHASFYGFQVLDLKFGVDDFLVADRIDAAVDVDDVRVVETTDYVENGIRLAYICKKLVSKTFTFAGTAYKACDVDDVDRGWNDAARMDDVLKDSEAFVRNVGGAQVWIDCAEWKVRSLCLG